MASFIIGKDTNKTSLHLREDMIKASYGESMDDEQVVKQADSEHRYSEFFKQH